MAAGLGFSALLWPPLGTGGQAKYNRLVGQRGP